MASTALPTPKLRATRRKSSPQARRDLFWGLFFCSPAIIGLLCFTIYPVLASLYYSFTNYSIFGDYDFIGLQNYRDMITDDLFWSSLWKTVYFLGVSIPVGIALALALALLLNLKVKGMSFYRTIFFLPSIVPAVAAAIVWGYVFNPQYGIFNNALRLVGINGPGWLANPTWVIPSLIIIGSWGAGNLMIILLAGLQDVPQDLQDAAVVDGANWWSRFRHVTLPFLGPHLFFALVTGLIGGFQYFATPFALYGGEGGPAGSALVYGLYLYQNAFRFYKMGYASAMAWVLLLIIVATTAIIFRIFSKRVYYGGA